MLQTAYDNTDIRRDLVGLLPRLRRVALTLTRTDSAREPPGTLALIDLPLPLTSPPTP